MKKIIGLIALIITALIGYAQFLSPPDNSETETQTATSMEVLQNSETSTVREESTTRETAATSTPTETDPLLMQEVPEGISSQILIRKAYVSSYNKDTKQANWVAWCLTREHTSGSYNRNITSFHEDYDVPEPRATHYDYKKSGWSRGHLCPAGDNKWDETAMRESFLMTNMSPQHQALNGGTWNSIEQESRTWARRYGRVYIVTGPLFLNQTHEYIGRNKIAVPEAFWKVILRLGDRPAAIGYICRNSSEKGRKNDYINSIAQIERITKIKFFPHLDPKIKAKIQNEAKLEDW